jgi:periplasmic protein CpxP/Spy
MSKIKLLAIAVIGLLAVNIAVVSFFWTRRAQMPPAAMPPVKPGGPKEIIIEQLHFNSTQVAAYEILIIKHRRSVEALKDSISNTKNLLYQSLQTASFSGKDSLINVLSVLQKQTESVHYDHFIQIKNLCTPEQMAYFNRLTHELSAYFATERQAVHPPPGE